MKLQILVPQYKETDEVIKPLLDSLAIQQNVPMDEFGVIICNDGSDIFLTEDFLKSYPYTIEYYKEEHRGVSATRNACLDRATADYIMFCDADDMFFNACGLWIIFREIENSHFDSFTSVFLEEQHNPETKEMVTYINREQDSTFVHGKVHRRQYLIDEDIRWNPDLTIHEDSYFNILCQNLSENVVYCPSPFYLWRWRDESVCRHDPKYILKTYNNMLDSNTALVRNLLSRGQQPRAAFFVVNMIFDAYYTMNKEEWKNQENQEYRDTTELRFKQYYLDFKDMWDNTPINDKMIVSNMVRTRQVMEGMRMEAITIDRWLEHVEQLE